MQLLPRSFMFTQGFLLLHIHTYEHIPMSFLSMYEFRALPLRHVDLIDCLALRRPFYITCSNRIQHLI